MEHCYVILNAVKNLYLPTRRLAPSLNRSTGHFLNARSNSERSEESLFAHSPTGPYFVIPGLTRNP